MSHRQPAEFEIGDILSMLTGILVSRSHMDGLHRLAEHLAGEPIWTHQLPRIFDESKGFLAGQFPDLAAIEIPSDIGPGNHAAWMDGIEAEHGKTRMVPPLPSADHTSINPVDELRMKGIEPIVVDFQPED